MNLRYLIVLSIVLLVSSDTLSADDAHWPLVTALRWLLSVGDVAQGTSMRGYWSFFPLEWVSFGHQLVISLVFSLAATSNFA